MQRTELKRQRRTRRLDGRTSRNARRRRLRQSMAGLGITMGAMAALAGAPGKARGQVSTGGPTPTFGGGTGRR